MRDYHFEGSPEALRNWLLSLGWDEVLGINSTPTVPSIFAFGPFDVRRVLGQDVGFVLIVASDTLDVPEGIMESDVAGIAVGVMMQGPKKPTPIEWMDRLSSERQIMIHAQAQANPILAYALFRLGAAQIVDVSLEDTQNMIHAMFQASIITSEERDILLV